MYLSCTASYDWFCSQVTDLKKKKKKKGVSLANEIISYLTSSEDSGVFIQMVWKGKEKPTI